MAGKKELLKSRCGVTLVRITLSAGDGNGVAGVDLQAASAGQESFTVTSQWTPGPRVFALQAEAEAYFSAEVARAPQRPSLYGDRYKPE